MDIIDKARELGTLIRDSEFMKRLKNAEISLEADPKAKELMNDYKKLQIEMVKATKANLEKDVIEEIKTRLLAKQDEIAYYDVTREFLESKSEFDKMMKKMNDVIIFAITGEEPCSPNKCKTCGGGCK